MYVVTMIGCAGAGVCRSRLETRRALPVPPSGRRENKLLDDDDENNNNTDDDDDDER